MSADYKAKYLEVRDKLVEATDVAFRLGYEEGMRDGEMQAQQAQMQAQQEQMAQAEAMMGGGEMPPGAEGGGEMPPGMEEAMAAAEQGEGAPPEAMDEEQAGELDAHIQALEEMVAKGEKPSVKDMRGKVEKLSSLRKNQKEAWKKKTSQTLSSQKSFVDNLIKKWESDAKETVNDIDKIIKDSGVEVQK